MKKIVIAGLMCLAASLAVCSSVQAQQADVDQKPYAAHHRIADKRFWLAVAVNTLATVANVESTHHCLAAGTCTGSPMFGNEPSRLRMYGTALPIQGAFDLTTFLLKKHDQSNERIGQIKPWIPRWVEWNTTYDVSNLAFAGISLTSETPVTGTQPRVCPGSRGCY